MVQIPSRTIPYYEAGIYLPMLLIILEKDYAIVDQSPFKFNSFPKEVSHPQGM